MIISITLYPYSIMIILALMNPNFNETKTSPIFSIFKIGRKLFWIHETIIRSLVYFWVTYSMWNVKITIIFLSHWNFDVIFYKIL